MSRSKTMCIVIPVLFLFFTNLFTSQFIFLNFIRALLLLLFFLPHFVRHYDTITLIQRVIIDTSRRHSKYL